MYATILKAVIIVIVITVRHNHNHGISFTYALLFPDSKAAIRYMDKKLTARHSPFVLKWVPKHKDINGNCKADGLVKVGATLEAI